MDALLGKTECARCTSLERELRSARRKIQHLQAKVHAQNQRLRAVERQLQNLQEKVGLNSSNSSRPPSSDLWKPHHRRRPASGRQPGGQPGHQGHYRPRLPPQRINHYVHYFPATCACCQRPLPQEPQGDAPPPQWHQVVELPSLLAMVTEHQAHALRCVCGHLTYAAIPAPVLRHCFGPRLAAAISYFSARCHNGKRTVQEILIDVFDAPISLGSIPAKEREMQRALALPYAQAQRHVRHAAVKYVDETTWKSGRQGRWLWLAATEKAALYRVHRRRSRKALRMLLGTRRTGTIVTDRHGAYDHWPDERRQFCWAHLERDFTRLKELGMNLGGRGLGICRDLFGLWRDFRQGKLSRVQLQSGVAVLRKRLRRLLWWWEDHGQGRGRSFALKLLSHEAALWTFASVEGVEPTNNHAERMLRPAVLWRKNCFGSNSRGGCMFVERILTVIHTLRLQERKPLEYLARCIRARREKNRPPRLLSAEQG
jgi:transposase